MPGPDQTFRNAAALRCRIGLHLMHAVPGFGAETLNTSAETAGSGRALGQRSWSGAIFPMQQTAPQERGLDVEHFAHVDERERPTRIVREYPRLGLAVELGAAPAATPAMFLETLDRIFQNRGVQPTLPFRGVRPFPVRKELCRQDEMRPQNAEAALGNEFLPLGRFGFSACLRLSVRSAHPTPPHTTTVRRKRPRARCRTDVRL